VQVERPFQEREGVPYVGAGLLVGHAGDGAQVGQCLVGLTFARPKWVTVWQRVHRQISHRSAWVLVGSWQVQRSWVSNQRPVDGLAV
jgi:hypothetical protein